MSVIRKISPLSGWATMDPFLMVAHHVDYYPEGNEKMEVPRRDNGSDLSSKKPYRMYHGDRIPGFPQHPHRGFETLTATLKGTIDHTDSLGTGGRYGDGDLQWMTAGKGIVHGENFPLVNSDKPNTLHLFQIWLNLPAKKKYVEPTFAMHWHEEIPVLRRPGAEVIVWAGELQGLRGLPPPKDSYARQPEAEVAVWHISLKPGASLDLPAASSSAVNRCLYFYEGSSISIEDKKISVERRVELDAGFSAALKNSGDKEAHLLFLQGRPLNEPVVARGPFVMNTQQEIMQAFLDYQLTQFGGWPWPQDAVVFPKGKGRFALINGKEYYPPSA